MAYDATADRPVGLLMEEDVETLFKRGFNLLPDSVQNIVKSFSRKKTKKIDDKLNDLGFDLRKVVRRQHHFLHAATAYYGFRQHVSDPHLVMTLDGGGDDLCSQVYLARDGKLNLLAETKAGDSIGNLYSRVTHLMGMTPHEHEYKPMGLTA
jgi:predicted NodU family carbamoyl transferase